MKLMKKSQGLSLNTIIIAAIVLIVLIVLWAIFTGRMGGFVQGLQQAESDCDALCKAAGYTLEGDGLSDSACTGENIVQLKKYVINGDDKYCCCKKPT